MMSKSRIQKVTRGPVYFLLNSVAEAVYLMYHFFIFLKNLMSFEWQSGELTTCYESNCNLIILTALKFTYKVLFKQNYLNCVYCKTNQVNAYTPKSDLYRTWLLIWGSPREKHDLLTWFQIINDEVKQALVWQTHCYGIQLFFQKQENLKRSNLLWTKPSLQVILFICFFVDGWVKLEDRQWSGQTKILRQSLLNVIPFLTGSVS